MKPGWVLMVYWEVQSWTVKGGRKCRLVLTASWKVKGVSLSGQLRTGYQENKYRNSLLQEGREVDLSASSLYISLLLLVNICYMGSFTLCHSRLHHLASLALAEPDPTMWDAILGIFIELMWIGGTEPTWVWLSTVKRTRASGLLAWWEDVRKVIFPEPGTGLRRRWSDLRCPSWWGGVGDSCSGCWVIEDFRRRFILVNLRDLQIVSATFP